MPPSPRPRGEEQAATRIRPPCGWQLINVGELWRFRELLYFLIWRDVKVCYK
jgi:lipopolysaccharide transport system permease protein